LPDKICPLLVLGMNGEFALIYCVCSGQLVLVTFRYIIKNKLEMMLCEEASDIEENCNEESEFEQDEDQRNN